MTNETMEIISYMLESRGLLVDSKFDVGAAVPQDFTIGIATVVGKA